MMFKRSRDLFEGPPPSAVEENEIQRVKSFDENDFATVMSVFRDHGIVCSVENCHNPVAYLMTQTHIDKSPHKAKPGPYCFECSMKIAPECKRDDCVRPCKICISADAYLDFCPRHAASKH